MSLGSHLEELRKKHATLSEQVEDAQPDVEDAAQVPVGGLGQQVHQGEEDQQH